MGAVTFFHRFGPALNANPHFHRCVIDGLSSVAVEEKRFHPAFLTEAAIARLQQLTRRRVQKQFERHEVLSENAVERMRG